MVDPIFQDHIVSVGSDEVKHNQSATFSIPPQSEIAEPNVVEVAKLSQLDTSSPIEKGGVFKNSGYTVEANDSSGKHHKINITVEQNKNTRKDELKTIKIDGVEATNLVTKVYGEEIIKAIEDAKIDNKFTFEEAIKIPALVQNTVLQAKNSGIRECSPNCVRH